ncbi:MAG: hypothetical protein R3Y67_09995 [Eubacteriales bacterium]
MMDIDESQYSYENCKKAICEIQNEQDEINKTLKKIQLYQEELCIADSQSQQNLYDLKEGFRGEEYERFFYQSSEENQSNIKRYQQSLLDLENKLFMQEKSLTSKLDELIERQQSGMKKGG